MAFAEALARGRRDLVAAARLWRWRRDIALGGRRTLADLFEDQADRMPEAPALQDESKLVTWRDHDRAANRVARFARAAGIRRGDVVALLIAHGPDLLSAWLGLAKIGATALLLDTRLGVEGLAFALARAGAGHLLSDAPLAELALRAADRLDAPPVVWAGGCDLPGTEDLDAALAGEDGALLPKSVRHDLRGRDTCFLITAHGPGSLPLPARISHCRALLLGATLAAAMALRRGDRILVPLPLSRIAPGIGAITAAAHAGASLCLGPSTAADIWAACRRHRTSHLWSDRALAGALLALPETEAQAQHSLRLVVGEDVPPEQWRALRARFGLPRLLDCHFDAAANLWLFDTAGRPGALGRAHHGRWAERFRIVAIDAETGQPVRDGRGRCVAAPAGEVGEAIGPAAAGERDLGLARFEGFRGLAGAGWRELGEVCAAGDRWLRSFTLMRREADGFVFATGPVGEVLRWQGEDVATAEIAAALALCPGVAAAIVYGVPVPHREGQAPMAALAPGRDFDLAALHARLAHDLPPYARPLFLRLLPAAVASGRRRDSLAGEGFDPAIVSEPLYVNDSAGFVPLDRARHARLLAGAGGAETKQ